MSRFFALAPCAVAAAGLLASASAWAGAFSLTSPDFGDGDTLPAKHAYNEHGCKGQNVAPELRWSGEPEGTQGIAVTLFDPDARRGQGFWHWLVWNVPGGAHALSPGALPPGAVQGATGFGASGYGGPCPPPGDPPHHYVFTVYAMPVAKLPLAPDSPPEAVKPYLEGHALAHAQLTGRYGR